MPVLSLKVHCEIFLTVSFENLYCQMYCQILTSTREGANLCQKCLGRFLVPDQPRNTMYITISHNLALARSVFYRFGLVYTKKSHFFCSNSSLDDTNFLTRNTLAICHIVLIKNITNIVKNNVYKGMSMVHRCQPIQKNLQFTTVTDHIMHIISVFDLCSPFSSFLLFC